MIRLEVQYFNFNKHLLLAIEIKLRQNDSLQLTSFITLKCTFDLVIKVVSSALFFTVYLIQYNSFCVKIKNVKNLLTQLQHVYDELKDEEELAIIRKYGYNAKRATVVLTGITLCLVSFFLIIQCWTKIFDVVLSINITRTRRMEFVITEYFVNQENYLFFILLHINVAFCIGTAVILATGTLLIGCLQLILGMFKISSYRIERAIKIYIPQDVTVKNRSLKSESLIHAVVIHREAMRLSKYLIFSFETMFISLAGIFIISLCFNFFRIFQIATSKKTINEIFFPVIFAIFNIVYLFVCNLCGQNIIDYNNHVFATAYNVQWYLAPLHIQKMILFLLLKGAKDFTVVIGGIFVSSIECFASVIRFVLNIILF
ncbi:uncharacterized protein [Cardiocondyla obscurior]|uniref:uncharacterized protein n=1 Tax=Cardiocondyla obscurior TaxID=286306 RepID=UPI00396568FA